jgi:hypothetical protein
MLQKPKPNPFMDDEAEEVNLPQKGGNSGAAAAEEDLEDSSDDEPKTWDIKDVTGKTHTVSIKEIKGKWINMSTGVRIQTVLGKSAEEVVQDTIEAGDEADLLA